MSDTLTAADRSKLRHMLGVEPDRKKKDWGFRNYYACGGSDEKSMRRLEVAGFVRQGRPYNESFYFHATEEGCKAVGMNATQIKRISRICADLICGYATDINSRVHAFCDTTLSPLTDYHLPITDYRLPITDYRSPLTSPPRPVLAMLDLVWRRCARPLVELVYH